MILENPETKLVFKKFSESFGEILKTLDSSKFYKNLLKGALKMNKKI